MLKRQLTEFGKQIKIQLMEENQTQEWLIEQLREKSGQYVDSSNLYKIMTGTLKSNKIESCIREVLKITT